MRAFDGTKKQVQRMTADGYQPTKLGHEYFKYAKDRFHIEYPTRLARPIGKKTRQGTAQRWQLDNETFDYHPRMEPITVGQLRALSMRMATDADKEAHALEAAQAWIRTQSTIRILDPGTGEESDYYVVVYDSPHYYVWDVTRPIRILTERQRFYDRSNPTLDETSAVAQLLRGASWMLQALRLTPAFPSQRRSVRSNHDARMLHKARRIQCVGRGPFEKEEWLCSCNDRRAERKRA